MKTDHLKSTTGEEGDLGPNSSFSTENTAKGGYTNRVVVFFQDLSVSKSLNAVIGKS